MRKQLIGTMCLGALSVIGLVFWEPPALAADKTVEIVPGPVGPVVRPEAVEINANDSIIWKPQVAGIKHQILDESETKITEDFNATALETAKAKFPTAGPVKYHCKYHATMKGTITVK